MMNDPKIKKILKLLGTKEIEWVEHKHFDSVYFSLKDKYDYVSPMNSFF